MWTSSWFKKYDVQILALSKNVRETKDQTILENYDATRNNVIQYLKQDLF